MYVLTNVLISMEKIIIYFINNLNFMSKLSMGHHNAWVFIINILNHTNYSLLSIKHVVEPMNHHGPILGD